jgi:hypothetical protein
VSAAADAAHIQSMTAIATAPTSPKDILVADRADARAKATADGLPGDQGSPFSRPRALASLDRATTQSSLLDRTTTTGRPSSDRSKARSHETQKLFTSTRAIGSTRPSDKSFTGLP